MLYSYLTVIAIAAFATAMPAENTRRDDNGWTMGFQDTNGNGTPPGHLYGAGPLACTSIPNSNAQGMTGSSSGFSDLLLCAYSNSDCTGDHWSLGNIESGGSGETASYNHDTDQLEYINSYKVDTAC